MRDIRFRGKVYPGTVNEGQWRYWKLFEQPGDMIEAKTVGQYIGLDDCEGDPIYEGDIIELDVGSCKAIVVYSDLASCCQYEGICLKHGRYPACDYKGDDDDDDYCEGDLFAYVMDAILVIGNIHDSPERVKESYHGSPE